MVQAPARLTWTRSAQVASSCLCLLCFIAASKTPRVQVPDNHRLSEILTYIATILKPSTSVSGPLDPWGKGSLHVPGCPSPTGSVGRIIQQAPDFGT